MSEQIVFFDGVCNLCNGFVDFLVRHDRQRLFRVASLQGETAKRILPVEFRNLATMVLWSQGQCFERSDAVLTILRQLGFPWNLLGFFRVVPKPLRDLVYKIVAASRYRVFGKRSSCRLPSKEERAYFLE